MKLLTWIRGRDERIPTRNDVAGGHDRQPRRTRTARPPTPALMNTHAHSRGVRIFLAVAGAVAAGYLWAVVFGDGVRGMKSVPSLDETDSFPDANAAFLVAIVCYAGSPVVASRFGDTNAQTSPLRWFGATAIVGACIFALSRLFV
jgi:hypothetical protein